MSPWQNPGLSQMFGKREPKLTYSALITGADYNAGRIVKRLEELGLREDTLVVFTADQGWNADITECGVKATAQSHSTCTRGP
jgi:arylsulfatase A-like enzyme